MTKVNNPGQALLSSCYQAGQGKDLAVGFPKSFFPAILLFQFFRP